MKRDKFKGRYRIDTVRLRGHDYASSGWYHVVICTAGRRPFFGEVRSGIMGLSAVGCVAHRFCAAIPIYSDRAVLDAFVVMPNHVHAIIGLLPDDAGNAADDARERNAGVETFHETSLRKHSRRGKRTRPGKRGDPPVEPDPSMADISPEAGSLSAIVRSYKSAVTRRVRSNGRADFGWQPRFYDRVIRNERERRATSRYVVANPLRWHRDRHHPSFSQTPPPSGA